MHFHHPLPSTLFFHSIIWKNCMPGRQHNDGKWSARCQGPERDWLGVRRSAVCSLPCTPALSGLQDEQQTKQPETAAPAQRFGAQTCIPSSPISFAQGQRDEYKKQNCHNNDHNRTVIQTLFSSCSELIQSHSLAPPLNAALRWHLPSTPISHLSLPTVTSTPGFPLLIYYAIPGTHGSF